jgi:hypothetical protein
MYTVKANLTIFNIINLIKPFLCEYNKDNLLSDLKKYVPKMNWIRYKILQFI